MPSSIRAVCVLALCLLCACNDLHRRNATTSAGGSDRANSQATRPSQVYADADAALAEGERALQALRSGDAGAAADGLAGARASFKAAFARCAATPACLSDRILQQQDALLDRQAQALLGVGVASPPVATRGAPRVAADGGSGDESSPVLVSMPESERSLNLLKGHDLGELIKVNEALRAAMREWLTWMRPQLLDAYENYQYMRYKMWPAYAKGGLPEALLFGILAKESGGKVHAVSPAGASGPLQFMPDTGRRYGLGVVDGFDKRFDPAASTAANVAYLNDQFAHLNNDLELTIAAYNGGESRMARLSRGGERHFWDPRVFGELAPETREYVPMVLAAAWLFLHSDEYGLRLPQIDERPGEIVMTAAMSLNELSMCLGQDGNDRGWYRTLRNLNPRWDPNNRLGVGTHIEAPARAVAAYTRRCTGTEVVTRMQSLQDARIPGVTPGVRIAAATARNHVVARGETLSTIARKHGCNGIKDLATVNGIASPQYAIHEGQTLRVPECRA